MAFTKKTGLRKLEHVMKKKRWRWLGHVPKMEDSKISRQAIGLQWELWGYKRKLGRTAKKKLDGQ